MFYEEVFRALDKANVRYMVVSGLAVYLYGIERTTHDLDLFVEMTPDNLEKLVAVFTALGYHPRVPVDPKLLADPRIRNEWMTEKNMKAFTFYHPTSAFQTVDIVLESPVDFGEASKSCKIREAENLRVPVISIPDLIKMKEHVARAIDLWDIKMLKLVKEKDK